jgi:glycosyltransferase involved in cell wall biosynthesis
VKRVSQELVSVVVPAYNGEKCLGKCLKSILEQTWQSLEVLVVDDGSTDRTGEIAEEAARRDSRVRVIHQRNQGVACARNAALPHCRGTYVRFVDCDDLLPKDSVEILVRKAEENDSDLVLAAYTEVVGNLRHVRNLGSSEETMSCDAFLQPLSRYANSFFYGVLWNKLFRTELINRQPVRFVSGLNWGEDFVFVTGYLKEAERVSFTCRPVYDYVRNPQGLTVHQALDCVRHPVRNIRMKRRIYRAYRELYVARHQYDAYRKVLWKYMIRVTINN